MNKQLIIYTYLPAGVGGRIETRTCYVENNLDLYDNLAAWTHLKSIVMIASKRQINEKTTTQYRFYLSNLALESQVFNDIIRKHWSTENR